MRFWTKSVALLIAVATTFGAVGCSFPPSRIGFIEQIAKDNRRIAKSTRTFRAAIIPLKTGTAADAGQVRSAYQEMEKTVKEVRAEMDAQPLPSSSSSAKALLSAYKDYLNGQQSILTDDLLPIVKKVEEPGGTPAAKWGYISEMLAKVSAKDNADYGPLMQAQTAYASEHNYTLQTQETYLEAQKAGKQ
ncbi:MAG TPA: hypothetical protein DDY78_18970 [Planctomycetales bacterium]|jgi:hypothetical protein|nr:hypothetical protein [Planctomycetales bacterium]